MILRFWYTKKKGKKKVLRVTQRIKKNKKNKKGEEDVEEEDQQCCRLRGIKRRNDLFLEFYNFIDNLHFYRDTNKSDAFEGGTITVHVQVSSRDLTNLRKKSS